jgi:hypothetical protein
MTFRIISYLIESHLHDNLDMTVTHIRVDEIRIFHRGSVIQRVMEGKNL